MGTDEETRRQVAAAVEQTRERDARLAEAVAEEAATRYVEGGLLAAGARMVAKAIRGES